MIVNQVLMLVGKPEKKEAKQESSGDRGARRTKQQSERKAGAAQWHKSSVFQPWPSKKSS
jgi:hypothetical protein